MHMSATHNIHKGNSYMNALVKLREQNNLTRKEIAAMLNIRYSNYCTLERSNVELPLDYVVLIATEFNIPFYELIEDEYARNIAKTIKIV